MTPEEQVKLYEQDTNAEQKIRDAITGAYKDLQPESELVRTYENEQFPSFYSALSGYGVDSGLTGLSPLTLLQNAWKNQARMATAAQVARDAFDVRRAGMEDLIKTGVSQWATGYQGAQNAYDRWWAQKQHEDQMALAREQMRRALSGGGGVAVPPPPSGMTAEELAWYLAAKDQAEKQEKWNEKANEAWNKAQTTGKPLTAKDLVNNFRGLKTTGKNYTPKPLTAKDLVNNFRGLRYTSTKPVQSKPLYTPVSSLSGYSTVYKPLTAKDLVNNFKGLR